MIMTMHSRYSNKHKFWSKLALISFAILLFSSTIFTQSFRANLYSGQVLDIDTKQPIIGAHVRIPGTEKGTVSDINGYFEIELDSFPTTIVASFLGYETASKTIRKNEKKIYAFYMKAAVTELETLTITAKPIIKEISSKSITIKDFVFVNEFILLLAYENVLKPEQLILINEQGDYIFEKSLDGMKKIEGLTRSCLDGLHLVTEFQVFQIYFDEKGIQLDESFPRWKYDRLMKPCVTSSKDYVYYELKTSQGQSITFEALPKQGGLAVEFGLAMDEEDIERYMDDLYEMDIRMRATTSVSIQDPDELRKVRRTEAVVDAWYNMFYQDINIQLFNLGEELVIFNHQDLQMEFFDLNGNFKRVVPITYSRSKKWDGLILLDKTQQKFYTRFDDPKGKVLSEINLNTGQLTSNTLVDCTFIETMKIKDGMLYYLESGVVSKERNRVLHRVKL
jgi:hypothetical protein